MARSLLITGAGGYVCSHLAEGLAALGWRITALDRHFDARTRARLADVEIIETNLDADSLTGLAEHFNVVVHGAALTSEPQVLAISPTAHIRANLDMTIDALGFAEAQDARFVFLSSSGVFSSAEAALLMETTEPTGMGEYAMAKQVGEKLTSRRGDRGLVVRLGPIYGGAEESRVSRQRVSLVATWIAEGKSGSPLSVATPRSKRDWTYVRDLAPALDRLLAQQSTGIIHLTSSDALLDLELAQRIVDLSPGWTVETNDKGAQNPRVPMVSHRSDLNGFAWTPLDAGLMAAMKEAA